MHGFHEVPRRPRPAVVTIDSRTRERRTPRFLNLVVRGWREWEDGPAEESLRYREAS